jgi:GntR family transcriptional repressor for pyruvate dehydrogenase complex
MPRSYEAIVEHYVARIVDGELAPGDRLPREQDLAEEFDLSRGVAREAIRALQERGLVRVTHGRGQHVADLGDWKVLDPDVLASMLTSADGRDLLDELVECRLVCEVDAAGLAAERATEEELGVIADRYAVLRKRRDTVERPAALAAALAAERAFHETIVAAAHNRPLAQMLRPVLAALEQAGDLIPARATAQAERRRIFVALIARDAGAAREAMEAHLRAIARSLRRAR